MQPNEIIALLTNTNRVKAAYRIPTRNRPIAPLLVFVYCMLLAALLSIMGWLYSDWVFFELFGPISLIVCGIIVVILVLILIAQRFSKATPTRDNKRAVYALRMALATPDNAVLPELSLQPDLPETPAIPTKRQRIGPLAHLGVTPETWNPAHVLFMIYYVLVATSSLTIQLGLRVILDSTAMSSDALLANSELALQVYMPFFGLMLLAVVINLIITNAQNEKRLFIDESGLAWRKAFGWTRIAWSEIRVIGVFTNPGRNATYVIGAGERLVAWEAYPGAEPEVAAASAQLIQTVVAQTGLTARDLNPLVTAIAAQITPPLYPAVQLNGIAEAVIERARAIFAAPDFACQLQRDRRFTRMFLALLIVAVAIPAGAVYYVHSIAQPQFFATLPPRISRQAPIFTDSLRRNDGLWPVQQPTSADDERMVYTADGYTLNGDNSGGEVFATTQQTYSSVAIQVTVTEQGDIPPHTFDGVGVILRHDAREDDDPYSKHDLYWYCVFAVTYSGWRFDCGGIDATGQSDAIHKGPNATNTILVIARGNQYIAYVNGQYVGQFCDWYGDFPAAGQIGVVNLESGMRATFTDFTVWPVTSPPNPMIV